MSRKNGKKNPEAVEIICGCILLIIIFIVIPFPFGTYLESVERRHPPSRDSDAVLYDDAECRFRMTTSDDDA